MKEIIEFLEENRDGFLATVDDGQARVRIFQFQFEEDGKLFFITSNIKPVWEQINKNPKVEFCVIGKNMFPYLRITGKIGFSDNAGHKEKGFKISPLVRTVFQNVDNPIMEAIYIENGSAVLTQNPSGESISYQF